MPNAGRNIDHGSPLLTGQDPCPVEWFNRDSTSPVLLMCEHAGQAIPGSLGDLGLPEGALDSHRGWDVGAESLARSLARRLDAPLILQRYSRLVIDCNRPPLGQESVPQISDGIVVPANIDRNQNALSRRVAEIFDPLDEAIQDGFARHPRRATFSIHTFTPEMSGMRRPWHAGFLARRDLPAVHRMVDYCRAAAPNLIFAVNEPYQISPHSDWFIPAHAEPRALRHALIEVRNDQLDTPDMIADWAGLIEGVILDVLEMPT